MYPHDGRDELEAHICTPTRADVSKSYLLVPLLYNMLVGGTYRYPNDYRGKLELHTGTLMIVEMSKRYLLVPL